MMFLCVFSAVIFYSKVYIFLFLFFTFLDIKFPRQTTGKMRSNVTHLKLKMSIKVALKSYKSVLAENFNPIDFM